MKKYYSDFEPIAEFMCKKLEIDKDIEDVAITWMTGELLNAYNKGLDTGKELMNKWDSREVNRND